jgi:exopolysaccharide biosynthesis WecB/TagA/CpsF family protein
VLPRDVPLTPRAALADVIRGQARVVGSRTEAGRDAFGLPPGVVSPYELRAAAGLAYGDPAIEEARYEKRRTRLKDLATLARFAVTAPLARAAAPRADAAVRPRVSLLGVEMDALDTAEAATRIVRFAQAGVARRVFFVHPHALDVASRDAELRAILRSGDLVLPDGAGIRLAARLSGTALPANVNGTDLTPELLVELAVERIPVALVGGAPGVAARAAARWATRYGVTIAATQDGFADAATYDAWVASLPRPCVVLVGFGTPLQERFVERHLRDRAGIVAVTVGGLFDFASDDKPRAPMAMRELGLEWLFRLAVEPRRLASRYLVGGPRFLARVLAERLRGRGL